jgi:hypothetical protein
MRRAVCGESVGTGIVVMTFTGIAARAMKD